MPWSKIKQMVVPQEGLFFEKLARQAALAHEAAQTLHELLQHYKDPSLTAKRIKELEHQGDDVVHEIYHELNRSFIVPFDHTDLSTLATALDDVLDLINAAAKYLSVYQIQKPPVTFSELTHILVKQTLQIEKGIHAIKERKTFGAVSACTVEINRLENEADDVYTRGVSELFKETDAVFILKHKEIMDRLEAATDKAERAANVLSDIVIKHS